MGSYFSKKLLRSSSGTSPLKIVVVTSEFEIMSALSVFAGPPK